MSAGPRSPSSSAREHPSAASAPFGLLVVASSAGGVSALIELLGALPAGFGVPVVVAQHLNPRHDTDLDGVIERQCRLRVKLAEPGERAVPGTVYIAPPDQALLISAGGTFTRDDETHSVHPAADPLFASAADAYGTSLLVCVLTGAGPDGAAGARAVKEHGGTVLVQDPESAEFPKMPDSARLAADVHYVLPLDEMARVISRLVEGST